MVFVLPGGNMVERQQYNNIYDIFLKKYHNKLWKDIVNESWSHIATQFIKILELVLKENFTIFPYFTVFPH